MTFDGVDGPLRDDAASSTSDWGEPSRQVSVSVTVKIVSQPAIHGVSPAPSLLLDSVREGGDMGLEESGPSRACGGCSTEGGSPCLALVSRAAHGGSQNSADALSRVCEDCWHPVYGWIRRQGYTADAAEDLTQGYFTRFLEKRFVAQFQPGESGCFRPFLFVSVRNFLSNERDRERALKRGGGVAPLSLDTPREERGSAREPAAANTPETLLEQRRVERLVGDALECLRVEQAGSARRGRYQRLYPHLVDDPDAESYRGIAADWGVSESAVRVAVHRLRCRLREILRDVPFQ